MTPSARRLWLILLAAAAGLGLLAMLVFAPVAGVDEPYSAYNPQPEGASRMARALLGDALERAEVVISLEGARVSADSFADADPAEVGAVLVVQPATAATPREAAWLGAFVRGGGILLVAADEPLAHTFLQDLVETRFGDAPVLDFSFTRRPSFPVVEVTPGDPLLDGVGRLVLGHPVALQPGPDAEVLATTSPYAFEDLDRDGARSGDETPQPLPWLVRERVGAGEVLLLSAPDLLVNGMADVEDAAAFRANLAARLSEAGTVLVDESHRAGGGAISLLGTTVRGVPYAWRLGLLASAGAVAALALLGGQLRLHRLAAPLLDRLLPAPRPEPSDAATLRAKLLARHPDWDPALLDEALAALEARR